MTPAEYPLQPPPLVCFQPAAYSIEIQGE